MKLGKLNLKGTKNSFREAFKTPKRIVGVFSITAISFILFMMLVNPVYSYQLLSTSLFYFPEIVSTMVADQALHGYIGLSLTSLLAFLVGIVTITTGVSLMTNYNRTGSFTSTIGGVIGFASAGCASCGAGVLALMGVTGGAAVLPFNGLEVQLVSIILLITSLEYTGRQKGICKI